jgi:hypothetical protein
VDCNIIIKENLQWRKLYTEFDLRSLSAKEGSEHEKKTKTKPREIKIRIHHKTHHADGRTNLKEHGSFNLVQNTGHKGPVLRPRCIGPGRVRTHILFYSMQPPNETRLATS